MNSKCLRAFLSILVVCLAAAAFAQNTDQASVVPMATSKFITLPVVPACLTLSPQSGDPNKGEAMLLMKMKPACMVPWHWHTASEDLMIVSGKGKIEMKGAPAHNVSSGDYVHLPSKHIHQFSCSTNCTFFLRISSAFDIHYVDKDGNELPVEQVVKPATKSKPAKESKIAR